MLELAPNWSIDTERGPGWLFVRLYGPASGEMDDLDLAEAIWSLLEQQFVSRVVVELDELPVISGELLDQLGRLFERVQECDGMMRICGLKGAVQDGDSWQQLDRCLLPFRNRTEAVMGHRPTQPR